MTLFIKWPTDVLISNAAVYFLMQLPYWFCKLPGWKLAVLWIIFTRTWYSHSIFPDQSDSLPYLQQQQRSKGHMICLWQMRANPRKEAMASHFSKNMPKTMKGFAQAISVNQTWLNMKSVHWFFCRNITASDLFSWKKWMRKNSEC